MTRIEKAFAMLVVGLVKGGHEAHFVHPEGRTILRKAGEAEYEIEHRVLGLLAEFTSRVEKVSAAEIGQRVVQLGRLHGDPLVHAG